MTLLVPIISLVAGFIFIYLSADSFTDNSARIASIYKISPLLIGILILGFGTSAPEMIVSALAAFEKHPELSRRECFWIKYIQYSFSARYYGNHKANRGKVEKYKKRVEGFIRFYADCWFFAVE